MDYDEVTTESATEMMIVSINSWVHQNYFSFYCTLASLTGYTSVLRILPTPQQICTGDPYEHIKIIDDVLERRREHAPGFLIPRYLRLRLKRTKHFLESKCYFLEDLDEIRQEYQQEQLEARLADLEEAQEEDDDEDDFDQETERIARTHTPASVPLDIQDFMEMNGFKPSPSSRTSSPILALKNFIQSDSQPVSPISSPPPMWTTSSIDNDWQKTTTIEEQEEQKLQSDVPKEKNITTIPITSQEQNLPLESPQMPIKSTATSSPNPSEQQQSVPSTSNTSNTLTDPVQDLPREIVSKDRQTFRLAHVPMPPTYFQPIFVYESIVLESVIHSIRFFKSASFSNLGEITDRVWNESFKTWERIRVITNNEVGDVQTLKDWYHHKLHVFRIIHYGQTVPGWTWVPEDYCLKATDEQINKFAKKKIYRRQAFQPFPLGPRFEELAALFPSNSKYNPLAYTRKYYFSEGGSNANKTSTTVTMLSKPYSALRTKTKLATIPEPSTELSREPSVTNLSTSLAEPALQPSSESSLPNAEAPVPLKTVTTNPDNSNHELKSKCSLDYYGIEISDGEQQAVQSDVEDEADDEDEGDDFNEDVYSEPESIRPAPYSNLSQPEGKPAGPILNTNLAGTRNSSVSSPTATTGSATAHSQSGINYTMSKPGTNSTNSTFSSVSRHNSSSTKNSVTTAESAQTCVSDVSIPEEPSAENEAEQSHQLQQQQFQRQQQQRQPQLGVPMIKGLAERDDTIIPVVKQLAELSDEAENELHSTNASARRTSLAALNVMSRSFRSIKTGNGGASGHSTSYLKYPYMSALTFFDDVIRDYGNATESELEAIHQYIVKSPHIMLIIFDSYRDINALLLVAQTILRLEQTQTRPASRAKSRQSSIFSEETNHTNHSTNGGGAGGNNMGGSNGKHDSVPRDGDNGGDHSEGPGNQGSGSRASRRGSYQAPNQGIPLNGAITAMALGNGGGASHGTTPAAVTSLGDKSRGNGLLIVAGENGDDIPLLNVKESDSGMDSDDPLFSEEGGEVHHNGEDNKSNNLQANRELGGGRLSPASFTHSSAPFASPILSVGLPAHHTPLLQHQLYDGLSYSASSLPRSVSPIDGLPDAPGARPLGSLFPGSSAANPSTYGQAGSSNVSLGSTGAGGVDEVQWYSLTPDLS